MPRQKLSKAEKRKRLKKIMSLYYDHNIPARFIARRLGLSRAYVHQLLREAKSDNKKHT